MAAPAWARRALKLAVFGLLFLALLSLAIMIGSATTGPWEKAGLLVLAVAVYALAVPVHRIGGRRG